VKLDIPQVTQLLRDMFNAHFLMTSIAGAIGTMVFAVTGRRVFAIGIALIAAFAVWARLVSAAWDTQFQRQDAGDTTAVRRLHWGGMLCNAILLFAIVGKHSLCQCDGGVIST
jgi:hypothetical protein